LTISDHPNAPLFYETNGLSIHSTHNIPRLPIYPEFGDRLEKLINILQKQHITLKSLLMQIATFEDNSYKVERLQLENNTLKERIEKLEKQMSVAMATIYGKNRRG
jgi:regulator of replication initiation timing